MKKADQKAQAQKAQENRIVSLVMETLGKQLDQQLADNIAKMVSSAFDRILYQHRTRQELLDNPVLFEADLIGLDKARRDFIRSITDPADSPVSPDLLDLLAKHQTQYSREELEFLSPREAREIFLLLGEVKDGALIEVYNRGGFSSDPTN